MKQLHLCQTGLALYRAYEAAGEKHGAGHPATQAAHADYLAHVRGTSSSKGCRECGIR